MRKIVALVLLIITCLSCEEAPEDPGMKLFIIPEGEHYTSVRSMQVLQNETLEFAAVFDSSAIYDLGDRALQSSKNKLLGFSDCNSHHQDNSARFGWQWFDGRLEIYAYCYVNGARTEAFVGTVGLGEINRYRITLEDDNYIFRLNDQPPVLVQRGNTCDRGVYYLLWPYFGGSVPAPHDVRIGVHISY